MLRFSFAVVLVSAIFAIGDSAGWFGLTHNYLTQPLDILTNDRLRTRYYKCFMDMKPCITPDSKFFKATFPNAVATKCVKCNVVQKAAFETVVTWWMEHYPEDWEAMETKFIADAKANKTSSAGDSAESEQDSVQPSVGGLLAKILF